MVVTEIKLKYEWHGHEIHCPLSSIKQSPYGLSRIASCQNNRGKQELEEKGGEEEEKWREWFLSIDRSQDSDCYSRNLMVNTFW